MRSRRVVIGLAAASLATAGFAIYLGVLYGQLKDAFYREENDIPTRIYSDLTRLAPPQSRQSIEERLKALGYSSESPTPDVLNLAFTLHPIDYPAFLLPDPHPQQDLGRDPSRRLVVLHFSGPKKTDPLDSIQLGGSSIADIYLEPELVATFARAKQIRGKLKFEDIPANLWKAIIAIEDQHFLEHKGLDPRGIARAIYIDLRTRSFAQGGSTITQQLVKNLMARRTKNVFRKVNELFLALLLEATFDKQTILERYLNEVSLGQVGNYEVRGVAEGAEHYFGKDVKDLNLGEIALMAGLIRGAGFYSPYRYRDRAIERQHLVLKKMVDTGQIAEAEAQAAMRSPIRLAPPTSIVNKAPFFTDFVRAELARHLKTRMTEEQIEDAGFRVYTTLDMRMNADAQAAVTRGVADLEKRLRIKSPERRQDGDATKYTDRLEGALAIADQSNGFIRALVGGRSYAQSNFNRILNMRRQVGSTFKPIVYLTAFQRARDPKGVPYSPGHPIEDAPFKLIYDHGKQEWAPKNYEKEFLGWISYRTALAHSINTAAARLGHELGPEAIIQSARALGIEGDLPSVPSLSLGIAELTPIELLQVYLTFANHGLLDEPTVIRAITHEDGSVEARFVYQPKQVFDAGPIDLLDDMLTSVFIEGTARVSAKMGWNRPAAGKTGTTSHHRDAWFAGFTPQLTAVSWVGMDQPRNDAKIVLTGADSALPIWVDAMKKALDSQPPLPFPDSPNLTTVAIDQKSGLRADYGCPASQIITEKFEKVNEPTANACAASWPESVERIEDP